MAFKARSRSVAPQSGTVRLWGACCSAVSLVTRAFLSLATIAILAGTLLWLRLLQGPIELPEVGRFAAEQINAENQDIRVAIGALNLTLGADQEEPGLQVRDLEVRSAEGALLFDVPRAGMRFTLPDLINGRIQPVSITVIDADARLFRATDGELRFGIGEGDGVAISPRQAADRETSGSSDFEILLDVYAGRDPSSPILAKLDRIEILGANLTYDDRRQGSTWSTRDADIDVWRYAEGARVLLSVNTIEEGTPGASVRVFADRDGASGATTIKASFGGLRMEDLSAQLPELAWLNVIDGSVEGRAEARIDQNGEVSHIDGVVISERGKLTGYGPETGFDFAEVAFDLDPVRERITFRNITLNAPSLDATMTGLAALQRGPDGSVAGMAGQLDVSRLYVNLPEVFSDALDFDGGQISFRWSDPAQILEVRGARLSDGDLVFAVDGQARASEAGWITDVRAEAQNMTVQDLLAHWPVAAAVNARTWVADNIPEADMPNVLVQIRVGRGQPHLSLNFDYENLTSSYIDGMPAITNAAGRGHMSFHDLHLEMDEGQVEVAAGRIGLAGSSVVISDFWGDVTPARVDLVARGATAAILELIDKDPLRLVRKLGVDLSSVSGQGVVRADLNFPLTSDLRVDEVEADATAELADFAMPYSLRKDKTVRVRSERLDLQANTAGMRLRGPVEVEDSKLSLDWEENYGASPGGRTIRLSGRVGAGLRGTLGMSDVPIEGAVPITLSLEQAGTGPLSYAFTGDLTPVAVDLEALNWAKRQGVSGRLDVKGKIAEALSIEAFNLESGAFQARGSAAIDEAGALASVEIERLFVPRFADVRGSAKPGPDGVLDVRVTGGSLDLSDQLRSDGGEGEQAGTPLRVSFSLGQLRLSENVMLSDADGTFERTGAGRKSALIAGALAPGADVSIRLDAPPDAPGQVSITSENAGAVLEAADLYRGARGGRLIVDASLEDNGGLTGRVRIEDLVVRSEATFRQVLRDGGLDQAQQEVSSGGIGFRKIWIPFTYRDDVITLTDAVATSPALALKVNGTVNEKNDQMDLSGVMSPAYVLTGALNEIPLLGDILGGEGEGILAMTFTLRGATRNPDLSVNPLSVLAPGFLRKIFSGGGGGREGRTESLEAFEKRIKRNDR